MISTAGDATLSVADPSTTATGQLVNGTFALAQPLQGLGTIKTWAGPISNESVPVTFTQAIAANERAAHGHVQQDADVHPRDDDAVSPSSRGAGSGRRPS